MVTLENEYLKIEILPEIGGRIFSALDKTTNYDFFYKQHVIKPALIGVLGSWISGGVEFNWPFHHRASGFMPCDFTVESLPDGTAVCHLSEHDPIDRMKGMVSILLRPGEKRLETRMSLYNRTPDRRSFLWWENAAVPVNPQYQIFFPQDVTYVNFHYLKSRISYPIAGNGIFNGIPMEEPRDLSPDECQTFSVGEIPAYVTVVITDGGKVVAQYTEKAFDKYKMPEPITDMPAAKSMNSAQELYLAGVHVDQYRDPAVKPDSYWKEALNRDICHIPSLIAVASYEYGRKDFKPARAYIDRALRHLCIFNTHPESGEAY